MSISPTRKQVKRAKIEPKHLNPTDSEDTGRRVSEVTGIEPAISGLTGRRDNQLRYTSMVKNVTVRKKSPGGQALFGPLC